jgi:hypothetical protein
MELASVIHARLRRHSAEFLPKKARSENPTLMTQPKRKSWALILHVLARETVARISVTRHDRQGLGCGDGGAAAHARGPCRLGLVGRVEAGRVHQ